MTAMVRPKGKQLSKLVRAARDRRILAALAEGLSVREVARAFGVSATRVSQIRRNAETQRN